ncbi:MAG: MBL fold metallo-hydrolase [Candidatus Thermoplasmatota archaeon]|nr:MBL fold metallo-hydrolase [Candidatus Thermoplasmatota archaeon]MCL5791091.1 MBL fold metallo-hydrolase [Candidatus Thermoplasmatota archaeon]
MSNLKMNIISSGSKGNSTIIWDDEDAIVIDFGISAKRFNERVQEIDAHFGNLSIIVTHEHGDHASGLPVASRRIRGDIYLREKTRNAMKFDRSYSMGDDLCIGNFYIKAIPVSHDAVDPVGYIIENRGRKIASFSDLGFFPMEYADEIIGSDILAIEANHDSEMLRTGPYSEQLKRRISSNYGHMSNEQAALAIEQLSDKDTSIVLIHLSDENNTPEIAYNHVRDHLVNRDIKFRRIECARQVYGSSVFEV